MITIEPIGLHWLGDEFPEIDLCAHGGVVIKSDQGLLLDDAREDWALGPAALFLLRTLDMDHGRDSRVAEHIFPHCAHAFFVDGEGNYLTVGCPEGRDLRIQHQGAHVHVAVDNGPSHVVLEDDWAQGVLAFVAELRQFYGVPKPKTPSREDLAGWQAFWREVDEREALAKREGDLSTSEEAGQPIDEG